MLADRNRARDLQVSDHLNHAAQLLPISELETPTGNRHHSGSLELLEQATHDLTHGAQLGGQLFMGRLGHANRDSFVGEPAQ
jgi:hypothetical protein